MPRWGLRKAILNSDAWLLADGNGGSKVTQIFITNHTRRFICITHPNERGRAPERGQW
jgi:hypothetical protein